MAQRPADRDYLNTEYQNLIVEIERISNNTQWNGGTILDGSASAIAFQVGANGGQTISVNFGSVQASGTVFSAMKATNSGAGHSLSSNTTANALTAATAAITQIDSAITSVNSQRATFGAAINQLTYAVDNLSNVKVNSEAARSRVLDTDYAASTSELARTQIIQQAGTAMLARPISFHKQSCHSFNKTFAICPENAPMGRFYYSATFLLKI